MTESSTHELLTALVAAFGDPPRIVELLAPDVQWWITPTVGVLGSPTIGRESVAEAMRVIFGEMYTDVRTDVHHVIVDGNIGSARFTMRATALFADSRPYENEYCVWAEATDGAITRVWEYLDVAQVGNQFGF